MVEYILNVAGKRNDATKLEVVKPLSVDEPSRRQKSEHASYKTQQLFPPYHTVERRLR